MKAPERACRLQLDLQADTRDEVVRALEGIATSIDRGEISTGCSGGVHSGWTYEYVERAGPTHEEYHEQLKAYLAAKRAEKETSPVPVWPVTQHFDCHKCANHRTLSYMIVCPTCGNKRCPKASDHELACTNSNAPGQPGSIY